MRRLSAVGLGILATLAVRDPADASDRDGAWGFFDPTSLLIVVIGESVFLILLLLPAVLQFSRSRRPEGPQAEGATR